MIIQDLTSCSVYYYTISMKLSEADKVYIEKLRKMDGNQRAKIGAELYDMAYHLVESSVRNEYPLLSEADKRNKIRQRMNQ